MNQEFQSVPLVITVEGIQDENATVVKLVDYRGLFTTGSSKRATGDPKNYSVGLDLAVARAMIKHGKAILKSHGAK